MTLRALQAALGALLPWLVACGSDPVELPPPGHLLLHIDTDAPLPTPPGKQRAPQAPHPLFDRLHVDILRRGDDAPCPGCRREFDLDEDVVQKGGSFSIQAEQELLLRVRMFRIASVDAGGISPEVTVETFVSLPSPPDEGALEINVFLPTDGVGQSLGTSEAPVEAELGPPHASRVGTWPGARRIGCGNTPPPSRACVEGGAFWMGSPISYADGGGSSTAQRLVVISPFFVDIGETTVAAYRAAGVAKVLENVTPWSGESSGDNPADWCTYTVAADSNRDLLPVNCITWAGARDYCLRRGGDLPTEAQFEYLAGALESRPYPWGLDDPSCEDAIWGRGVGFASAITPCAGALGGGLGGPLALPADLDGELAPPRRRDVLSRNGVRVFDLGGNSGEWVRDVFQRAEEPCWRRAGTSNVLTDPFCEQTGQDGDLRSYRGGTWIAGGGSDLRAANRWSGSPDDFLVNGGFRCVYPVGG